jgi:N6-L-threonylcarbamoyladenine synthase
LGINHLSPAELRSKLDNKRTQDVLILGIESSCDDTSAAVLRNDEVLSNVVATQSVHEEFGGVVPELASRAHQSNIVPVVNSALQEAGIDKNSLDAVAVTIGPGLMGSLLVGTSFAKSMVTALDIPLIGVNHMQAHILAHFIKSETQTPPNFPFLCLTISGGHTQIVVVKDDLNMELIGTTLDDAAGEAFDKAAKLLGLGYPGGPKVDQHAKNGDATKYKFAKPRVEKANMSFSGIKSSLLYFLQKEMRQDDQFIENHLNDICASYQTSIVSYLFEKLEWAVNHTGITEVAIAGGVSANSLVRAELMDRVTSANWTVHIPEFQYCTDNAAMVGIAGYKMYLQRLFTPLDTRPLARMPF